jgi:hypothetical protein
MNTWFFARVVVPFRGFKRDTPVFVRRSEPFGHFVVFDGFNPPALDVHFREAMDNLLSRRNRGKVVFLEPKDEKKAELDFMHCQKLVNV